MRLGTIAALQPALNRLRPIYRQVRTGYLRKRYPRGGFVFGNGVRVFADFDLPSYEWYDADAPNLAFDIEVFEQLVRQSEGTVCIDVGAHFGFFSAVMAGLMRGCQGAKLIAIEPDPRNFRCLQETLRDVDVETVLLPIAAGDRDGMVHLFETEAPCLRTFAEASSKVVGTVESQRLDTIVRRHVTAVQRVAIVKVDIDGAEPYFLCGAAETLAQHRPIVMMEFCPFALRGGGFDPREFFERLTIEHIVYWVSAGERTLRRVAASDFDRLANAVGGGVTDLILTDRMIDFSSLAGASRGRNAREE